MVQTSGSTPRKNPKDALERRFRKNFASQQVSPSSPSKQPLLETEHAENDAESDDDEYTLSAYGDMSLTEDAVWSGGAWRGSLRPRIPRPLAPGRSRRRSKAELSEFEALVRHHIYLLIEYVTLTRRRLI